jgi:dTDP-4-dehydrorhamnose 3,5-epimerase
MMKLLEVKELSIPSVKVLKFQRFCDNRGYFTETYRESQVVEEIPLMRGMAFVQANESFSRKGVVRGLHFQWNPYMGKLVRTVQGEMVDIFLDIRKGSPTFGEAAAYRLASSPDGECGEWIWVPPGFAHGNYFTRDTTIEYLCSGEYSPGCEAGISPLSGDIGWSLCEPELKREFDRVLAEGGLMADKDRNGFCVATWAADPRSSNFPYESLR